MTVFSFPFAPHKAKRGAEDAPPYDDIYPYDYGDDDTWGFRSDDKGDGTDQEVVADVTDCNEEMPGNGRGKLYRGCQTTTINGQPPQPPSSLTHYSLPEHLDTTTTIR
jgi:hypothetical protein